MRENRWTFAAITAVRDAGKKVSAEADKHPGQSTHRPAILFSMSPAFHPSDESPINESNADSAADDLASHESASRNARDDDNFEPASDEELAALLAEDEDDPALEDEFPMGDGVADVSTEVYCPYCGEPVEIALDPGSGSHQQYVEDCQVCCQPWRVSVYYDEEGHADVQVTPEDES